MRCAVLLLLSVTLVPACTHRAMALCPITSTAQHLHKQPINPLLSIALQAVAAAPDGVVRQRIDKMSGEVVDSNPYSRLMALQRMGIVKDYEQIRNKTVRQAAG